MSPGGIIPEAIRAHIEAVKSKLIEWMFGVMLAMTGIFFALFKLYFLLCVSPTHQWMERGNYLVKIKSSERSGCANRSVQAVRFHYGATWAGRKRRESNPPDAVSVSTALKAARLTGDVALPRAVYRMRNCMAQSRRA